MIQQFENWFRSLSNDQQKELLDHILNNHIKSLNEGIFTGPAEGLRKGLFTGPVNSQKTCPSCKRPY